MHYIPLPPHPLPPPPSFAINDACKILKIVNVIDKMKKLTKLFRKWQEEALLESLNKKRESYPKSKKVPNLGLCKTRLSERDISYEHIHLAMPFMFKVFS